MKFIFKWLGIMFILSVITFLIVRFIPVSPVDMLLQHYNLPLTEENRKLLISYYKLDQSLFKQYIVWIKDFLKGNWGISFITKLPVKEEMLRRLPYSLIIYFHEKSALLKRIIKRYIINLRLYISVIHFLYIMNDVIKRRDYEEKTISLSNDMQSVNRDVCFDHDS